MKKSCLSYLIESQHQLGDSPYVRELGLDVLADPWWKEPGVEVIDVRNIENPEISRKAVTEAETLYGNSAEARLHAMNHVLDSMRFAPMFKTCWFEHRGGDFELSSENKVGTLVQAIHRNDFALRVSVAEKRRKLYETFKATSSSPPRRLALQDQSEYERGVYRCLSPKPIYPEARWMLEAMTMVAPAGTPVSVQTAMLFIDKDGHLLDWIDYAESPWVTFLTEKQWPTSPAALSVFWLSLNGQWLHAMDLLNSKNIAVAVRPTPPKVAAKRQRAGKPDILYKRLVVRVKKNDVRWLYPDHEPQKTDRRHHHVRGHFKTYTDDRPLFGKYTGRFYWAPQWRGLEEVGKVVKVYDIEPYEEPS